MSPPDDEFWANLALMTARRSQQHLVGNPGSYYAKMFKKNPVQAAEMKAFIGLQLIMEYFVIKRSYASYWSSSGDYFISETPGVSDIFDRDRFLGLWSFLHTMDENDPSVDKRDPLYKNRALMDSRIERFQKYYVPTEYLSLDRMRTNNC